MSELKRHTNEITDSLSIMSPFHKEIKLEASQHPGSQYFYQLSNNPEMLIRQNYLAQQQQNQVNHTQHQTQMNFLLNTPFFQQPLHLTSGNLFQPVQMQTINPPVQQQQYMQQQQQQSTALTTAATPFMQQYTAPTASAAAAATPPSTVPNSTSMTLDSNNNHSRSNNENSSKRSGEKSLAQFEQFLQMTSGISNSELNLDFVKDLYTVRIDNFPSNEDMRDAYQRIVSKQGYSKQQKKNWNDQELHLLVWIILKSCAYKHIDIRLINDEVWEDIASMMVGRSAEQCKLKWLSMSKLNLQQQPWSEEEDATLISIIKEYERLNKQNKWSEIAGKLNQINWRNIYRQGKQCRERWNNHLDPSFNRGPWTQEEELKMLRLVQQKGKRWSDISKQMQCARTENAVKNRFNSLIKKDKLPSTNSIESYTSNSSVPFANDMKANSNQDLTDSERSQIIVLIEKLESRIKNGFSLINISLSCISNNTLAKTNELIEEEDDYDNGVVPKRLYEDSKAAGSSCATRRKKSSVVVNRVDQEGEEDDDDEGEEEDDDDEGEEEDDQASRMSNQLQQFHIEQQNNQQQHNHLQQQHYQQQKIIGSYSLIKAEDNNNQSSNSVFHQSQSSKQSFPCPERNSPLPQQQLEEEASQTGAASLNPRQKASQFQKKSVLQSKHALFEMVSTETANKMKSGGENSLSNDSKGTTRSTGVTTAAAGIFQPINQSITITTDTTASCSSGNPGNFETNSPNLKQHGLRRNSKVMRETTAFNEFSTPQSAGSVEQQWVQPPRIEGEQAFVKRLSSRMDMRKEEFDDQMQKQQQLVFVDKVTNEIFLITPQYLQAKIQEDYQRNVAVLNSLMQESINTPQTHAATVIASFAAAAAVAASTTPSQQQQSQVSQLSLFLNTPPLVGQNVMHGSNSNISSSNASAMNLGQASAASGGGELTPNLFSYYHNNFSMPSQTFGATNSPSMFFLSYSNQNTPQQLGLTQITQQNPTHTSNISSQSRMINQMPLHQMMFSAQTPHQTNQILSAAAPLQNSHSNSAVTAIASHNFLQQQQATTQVKQPQNVLHPAAMLNKQLMHLDHQPNHNKQNID